MSRCKISEILLLIVINIVLLILCFVVGGLLALKLRINTNLEYTQKIQDHAVYLLERLTDVEK